MHPIHEINAERARLQLPADGLVTPRGMPPEEIGGDGETTTRAPHLAVPPIGVMLLGIAGREEELRRWLEEGCLEEGGKLGGKLEVKEDGEGEERV